MRFTFSGEEVTGLCCDSADDEPAEVEPGISVDPRGSTSAELCTLGSVTLLLPLSRRSSKCVFWPSSSHDVTTTSGILKCDRVRRCANPISGALPTRARNDDIAPRCSSIELDNDASIASVCWPSASTSASVAATWPPAHSTVRRSCDELASDAIGAFFFRGAGRGGGEKTPDPGVS